MESSPKETYHQRKRHAYCGGEAVHFIERSPSNQVKYETSEVHGIGTKLENRQIVGYGQTDEQFADVKGGGIAT